MTKPVASLIGPIAGSGLVYLETINQSLAVSINNRTKSAFTAEFHQLDKERDADILEIKRITSYYLKSNNEEKKTAASMLQLFLAPFWDLNKLVLNIETGVIDDMLTKYKARPELLKAATVLGIDRLFVSVEAKDKAFDTKFMSRNAECSERTDSASSFRPAALTAYSQFCTAVEQMVNFAPNDTVIALFNQLDELRKKYHALEAVSEPKVEKN